MRGPMRNRACKKRARSEICLLLPSQRSDKPRTPAAGGGGHPEALVLEIRIGEARLAHLASGGCV